MEKNNKFFAVLDTETNWSDQVMSIGIVIADADTFEAVTYKYYILAPEYKSGGMYSGVLKIRNQKIDMIDSRKNVTADIIHIFKQYGVRAIFAYNALFDCNHLSELKKFQWFDIMKIAAYRQFNSSISESSECYSTGRLKRNYGVEPIMRLLSGSRNYHEKHNALCDAIDELKIMKILGHGLEVYNAAKIASGI